MTIQELGMQYLYQEKNIRVRIRLLRKKLNDCSGNDSELQERIQNLYSMARNVRQIGNYLVTYYDTEGRYDS